MNFSNDPIDVIGIIHLFIPIITFAMGFFLTDIIYRRDKKLNIVREKFEKLYHPFYLMINELGTATEDGQGAAFSASDGAIITKFLEHLVANAYLATAEGQAIVWQTSKLFVSYASHDGVPDKEKERLLDESMAALFTHFFQEYIKSSKALGYEFDVDFYAATDEGQKVAAEEA